MVLNKHIIINVFSILKGNDRTQQPPKGRPILAMNSCPEPSPPTRKTGSRSHSATDAMYREQVAMLYRQFPLAVLPAALLAPLLAIVAWERDKAYPLLAWLLSMLLVTTLRYVTAQRFNRQSATAFPIHRWEKYYLAGISASALLWGATSLWLEPDSLLSQQILQLFIVTGLITASIPGLASRPLAFRLWLGLILLPYIIRFLLLGTPPYLLSAGFSGLYLLLMNASAMRIHQIINESLQLRCQAGATVEPYPDKAMQNSNLQELERSETFLRSIFITANDGIITSDAKGTILAVNHAIERDFGYTEQEMLGKSINMIMADEMGHKHDHYIEQYLNSDVPVLTGRMLDVMGKRKDGSFFPMEITVSETRIAGKPYFTGIIRDISDRKEYENAMNDMMRELAQAKRDLEAANSQLQNHNKTLTQLSEHDALTGLANRRFLMKTFSREWFRHQRNKQPISVILLDIDFFKNFNDSYGHQAGDDCLKQIAAVLLQNIARPADFIARYGGEEFIAVLPETELEGACHLAEKMRHAVEKLYIIHDGSEIAKHVTISGGVASIFPDTNNTCELLIKQADEALYDAKHSGRNCIRRYIQHTGTVDSEKQ